MEAAQIFSAVEEIGDSGWLAFAKVIPFFEEMERKYNLVELNTSVKPFYMKYLYRRDSAVNGVIYLDTPSVNSQGASR